MQHSTTHIWREALGLWNSSSYKKWFLFGAITHLLAVIFSTGYLHVDEHFQILEYMGHKLFNTPANDLAWEYHAKMRPWAQHFFYYLFSKPLVYLGLKDPFILHFLYRLISAVLGFWSTSLLCLAAKKILDDQEDLKLKWIIILSNVLWFVPYLHARISSETVGASLFVMAFSLFYLWRNDQRKMEIWKLAFLGFLFGYSFLIRYHIGVIVFFFLTWALVFKQINIKNYLITSFFIGLTIALGVLVDYWGYGTWTLAPWEYIKQNLVEDKASNYGVTPWWEYFKSVSKGAIQPFGWTIIAAHLILWIRKPLSLFTWITLPFFVIHSAIPHKELRFLFPLAPFIPFVLTENYQIFSKTLEKVKGWKVGRGFINLLIFVNFILLIQVSLKSSHTSAAFYRYTYGLNERIHRLLVFGADRPFWGGVLNFHYYNFHYPKTTHLNDEDLTREKIFQAGSKVWVFGNRGRHYLKFEQISECKRYYMNYPEFLLKIKIGRWPEKSRVWTLYQCIKN